jgi:uncharacterized protein
MTLLFNLLTAQALLGAFDNIWHHEITERLPSKRSASGELTLHAARDLIYAIVFLQLGWLEMHGVWATLLAATLIIEIVITMTDFLTEDRTRRLPPFERILHTVLAINFGMILFALAPILMHWWSLPTAIVHVTHGLFSWLFSLFALGATAFALRNATAVLLLRGPPEWVRDPIQAGTTTPNARTVLVTGGTGFIGGHLIRRLLLRGERIILLTRDADRALDRFGPQVRIITALTELRDDERIDAVVNLAGARILGFPWTNARRAQLINSRVNTTRSVVELCGRLTRPPRVFVTASAIGYYGLGGGDQPLDEQASPQPIFQSRLCQEWEAAAAAAESFGARVVRLRIGLVLARSGGALPQLAMPVRFGLGAILGSGKQWVSWIHIGDLIRLFEFALDTPTCKGAINAVSPAAATHAQIQRLLAKVLHRPMWLRIPAIFIRTVLGEMSQLLVDGQRVAPVRALTAGFVFKFPNLGGALEHLLGRSATAINSAPADIYYNGECPICRAEMSHYAELCATSRPELRFIDSTQQPNEFASCGLRPEHLERRVYFKDSEGRILSGMPAIISLWSRMPKYGWLATTLNLPVLRPATAVLYDHVIAPTLAHWAKTRARRAI